MSGREQEREALAQRLYEAGWAKRASDITEWRWCKATCRDRVRAYDQVAEVEELVSEKVAAALTEVAERIDAAQQRITYVDTRLTVDLATSHNIGVQKAAAIVRAAITPP